MSSQNNNQADYNQLFSNQPNLGQQQSYNSGGQSFPSLGGATEFPGLGNEGDFSQQQQQEQQQQQYAQEPQYYQDHTGMWVPYYPDQQQQQQWAQQQQQQQYQYSATDYSQQVQTPKVEATPSAGAESSTMSSKASTFNTTSTSFVPKKKMVKTEELFPTLDMAAKVEPGKAKKGGPVVVQSFKKDDDEVKDPCYNKNKEFFMIYGANPQMMIDQMNLPTLGSDQAVFMFTYYSEYAFNPWEMLSWLFQVAAAKEIQQTASDSYNQKPSQGGRKVKGRNDSSEEEYEESNYDYKKVQKMSRPSVPTSKAIPDHILKKMQDKPAKQVKAKVKEEKIVASKVQEELVEVDESRQPVSIVFIGHVDAGKSTISGQIMYLNGAVDERTIQKYKEEAKEKNRESWWLAYVMDVCEEEKAKGKTVEMGRAVFDTPKKRYTIFDAPGHKNYVPNMIMGAALADFGALVISAKRGEFEAGFDADGQTREHAQLARSLGIKKLIVVVNKMDEPSVKWSQDRFTDIQKSLGPFFKTCGFDSEKDIIYVPISGLTGENVVDKTTSCRWYTGPTLMEILDNIEVPDRDAEGPLRIPIIDKMRDRGIVLFGKVEQGTVRMNDKIMLASSGTLCMVINLYNCKGEPVAYAKPGENVQIRLLGVTDENMVMKGDVVCNRENPCPMTELFEAEIDILELLSYKPIVSKGYQFMLHLHTVSDDATIKDITACYETNDRQQTTEKLNPQYCKSFSKIFCRVQTRIPIPIEKFDILEQLGRFTVRDEGKTIAVGKILRYKPIKTQVALSSTQEETKADGQTPNKVAVTKKVVEEMVYDMDSGKTMTREEFNKAQAQKEELEGIDEDYDDEEEEGGDPKGTQATSDSKSSAQTAQQK